VYFLVISRQISLVSSDYNSCVNLSEVVQ
jgi:hypothetical protein